MWFGVDSRLLVLFTNIDASVGSRLGVVYEYAKLSFIYQRTLIRCSNVLTLNYEKVAAVGQTLRYFIKCVCIVLIICVKTYLSLFVRVL